MSELAVSPAAPIVHSYLEVNNDADADRLMERIGGAGKTQAWLAAQSGDPLCMLRRMKFEAVGVHPIAGHALNIVEQINQSWTFAVAVAAARQLLRLHPEAGGFRLAPGAHACLELDTMSEVEGLVEAETFAAVNPSNNGKLAADLRKLAARPEAHRYVFFMSPGYSRNERLPELERDGIQVWCVNV